MSHIVQVNPAQSAGRKAARLVRAGQEIWRTFDPFRALAGRAMRTKPERFRAGVPCDINHY